MLHDFNSCKTCFIQIVREDLMNTPQLNPLLNWTTTGQLLLDPPYSLGADLTKKRRFLLSCVFIGPLPSNGHMRTT
jgi:hypothetical protein